MKIMDQGLTEIPKSNRRVICTCDHLNIVSVELIVGCVDKNTSTYLLQYWTVDET